MPDLPRPLGFRALVVIAVIAVLVRALHLAEMVGDLLYAVPLGDERIFDAWARRIAAGDWSAGDGTGEGLYHAPGYAWFLGLVYACTGGSALVARAVQVLLGATAAALTADLTARVFGRRAGIGAGLLQALLAPLVFYESLLQKPALAVFFVALLAHSIVRSRERAADGRSARRPAFLGGLALGAGILVREGLVALLPLALLVRPGRLVERAKGAATLVAACLLVLALLPLRNLAAGDPFLASPANLGPNLWIGSGAGADGFYRALRPGRGTPGAEREDAQLVAEQAEGRMLSPAEVSDWWRARALADMRASPGRATALFARKLGRELASEEWMDSRAYVEHRRASRTLRVLAAPFDLGLDFGLVAALALGGALAGWRRRRAAAPLALGVFLLAGSIAVFFVFGRFRIVLVPLLAPFAGAALAELLAALRERRSPSAWLAAVPVALLLARLPSEADAEPHARTRANLASALERDGRIADAVALARTAVELAPQLADARFNLGLLLGKTGDAAGGRRELEEAARLEPAFAGEAWSLIAESFADERDEAGTRRALARAEQERDVDAAVHGRVGLVWRRLGELERAEAALRRALAVDPELAAARTNLGLVLTLAGRPAEACSEYERAIAAAPEDARPVENLGWLRAASVNAGVRDGAAALELAARLAELLGPEDPSVLDLGAAALAESGRFDEAAREAERAVAGAHSQGAGDWAEQIGARARLYATRRPFRQELR